MSKQNIQDLNVSEMQKAFKLDERKIISDKQNDEEIPVHWKLVQFGDVCSLRKETVQPSENQHANYIGLEHIDSGTPYLNRWGTASEVTSSKSKFYTGDVLYGKLRPYLDKAIFAEFDGICSTDILVFVSGIQLTSTFLSYFVHTRQFLDYAIQSTHGVNHPRTSWSSLAKYQFSLPTLSQQQAIAHVLQTVREAIHARRNELKLERERKAVLVEYLFIHGARGETTRQTEIGEIPASWGVKRLGEVATLQRGFDLPESKRISGSYPVMGSNGITGYHFEYKALGPGVFLGRSGSGSGKANWIEENYWPHNAALWVSDFHGNDPKFIYFCLFYMALDKYAAGASIPTLNRNAIHPLLLALPSIDEQKEISTILTACDTLISCLEGELSILEELFNALLEELMTGRLSTLPLTEEGESRE